MEGERELLGVTDIFEEEQCRLDCGNTAILQ